MHWILCWETKMNPMRPKLKYFTISLRKYTVITQCAGGYDNKTGLP